MTQEVRHYQVNQLYRIVIEQAASTKGTLGYKVEANGDDISLLCVDIETLKTEAEKLTRKTEVKEED